MYGEVYGGSIQNLAYGIPKGKGLGFRVFDIKCDGRYFDWDKLVEICQKFNVDMVPNLYRGPYSMDEMKKLAEGKTTLVSCGGDVHMREGIVVKPVIERIHPSIGRVVLKYISTEYDLDERITDSTDI
jgi:RNA ligase (TIGR02306 family)